MRFDRCNRAEYCTSAFIYTPQIADITASALLLVFRCFSGRICAHSLDLIQLSSYLHEWRLSQWRSLFEQEAKGCEEFLKSYGSEQDLTSDIRSELSEYSDEELCTVNASYVWQKPIA
jgi:hypothetical protein